MTFSIHILVRATGFLSTTFLLQRFLGSEGIARMSAPTNILLLFVLLLICILSYKILERKKRIESWIFLVFSYFLIFLFTLLLRYAIFDLLFAFLGMTMGTLFTFSVSNASSSESATSSSSTTISIESSDSLLSHSHLGAHNPEPGNPLISHFGFQNPNNEIEVYARIRFLESELIDRLPPQLHLGEYENMVRENLNQAVNLRDYNSALSNTYFDVTVLELKCTLVKELVNLLLSEPDEHLTQILMESPFNEGSIRTKSLDYLEEQIEDMHLDDPRYRFEKVLIETILRNSIHDLQHSGKHSPLYRGFHSYFRGSG